MGLLLERASTLSLSAHAARLFGIAWRVAIVLLPWQTRWFSEGVTLGGFAWEGGRVSIYASWVPIILSIGLYFFLNRPVVGRSRTTAPGLGFSLLCLAKDGSAPGMRGNDRRRALLMIFVATLFFSGSLASSVYLRATLQWWLETVLLTGFAWVTVRGIDRETLCRWVVYAIFPHAVLGIIQFCTQWVVGSKWLGMATQDPMISGVSVVESMGKRWLRAYGGFPHPNIFGGWLLMGLVSSIEYRVSSKKDRALKILILALFSSALVLTFSRSAWLAFVLLMGSIAFLFLKEWRGMQRIDRFRWLLPFVAVVVFGMTIIWQWPLVRTRSSSVTRLEAISVNERRVGIENGIKLFQRHPWLGVGPRTAAYPLVEEQIISTGSIPIIPHVVFVLMLDEIGLLGCLFLALIAWKQRRQIGGILGKYPEGVLYLLPVFLIFSLDHYPWSTWSGMSWVMLIFCVIFANKSVLDISPDRLAMYEQRN